MKFMKGVADEVVPDFPDASTPAVLVYKDTLLSDSWCRSGSDLMMSLCASLSTEAVKTQNLAIMSRR